ncbi:TPA: excinuclease ABC subunit UvrA, partial [Patescibacteria group bacterium]|nr:excinuclease ABC subunit UvrA [Patescibacteria group bacterium]
MFFCEISASVIKVSRKTQETKLEKHNNLMPKKTPLKASKTTVKSNEHKIVVRGARVHNLKNVDIDLPRHKLIVMTGLSGSGKSSLAFDTIYAEGQRRYVESLSAYARQFIGLMDKPDVDKIEGLSPAISIDQKSASHNPRSTVGTVTEIYDYMRLLYARIGIPHCPVCGKRVEGQTLQAMVENILAMPEGSRIMLLAPLIRDQKGEHKLVFEQLKKSGFSRVRVDGSIMDLTEAAQLNLDKQKKHSIEVIVDRIAVNKEDRARLSESLEKTLDYGDQSALVLVMKNDSVEKEIPLSQKFACPSGHAIALTELDPREFSFNSPHGACPECKGLGTKLTVEPDLVIANPKLTLAEGAIRPWSKTTSRVSWYSRVLESVAKEYGFSVSVPVKDLPKKAIDIIMNGTGGKKIMMPTEGGRYYQANFEGVIAQLERRWRETESDYMRNEIENYMRIRKCGTCGGKRLKPEVLSVTVGGEGIVEVSQKSIEDAAVFFEGLPKLLNAKEMAIANLILKEITARLKFLLDVGLSYLSLDRGADTLSGGEAQRIRLATQIGSGLTGVLY